MRKFADIREYLLEVQLQHLSKYVGCPVLVITPIRTYAYDSFGCKKVLVYDRCDEEWTIFNGDISLTEETEGRTYWTFKCLSNRLSC